MKDGLHPTSFTTIDDPHTFATNYFFLKRDVGGGQLRRYFMLFVPNGHLREIINTT